MLGDASAALGIIHRRGLGRTRHIDTGPLWIQQTTAEKRLQYSNALGTTNPADLMTKYLAAEANESHCKRLHVHFQTGLAEAAPTLSSIMGGKAVWEFEATHIDACGGEQPEADGHEEGMEVKFQHVVNSVWDKWFEIQ